MIYDPIPSGLCANLHLNGGSTKQYGCDGVICPLGSYSEVGYAVDKHGGCAKCPPGESTVYLGSTECVKFLPRDILSLFYDVMQGDTWPEMHRDHWKDPTVDFCEWGGVVCDDTGELMSLSFPLIGADDLY
jgi:hypothetical protein